MTGRSGRPIPGDFRGRLGKLVFTDRRAFEQAVPCYLGLNRHRTTFRVGETVYLDFDGETVAGQVWADGPQTGEYWVRGDDGLTYLLGRKSQSLGFRKITPTDQLGVAISDHTVRALRTQHARRGAA